ncbi:unnamed protein product [Adineta ricciae]|uniref:G-protein coupled receptors family 1 profile domain-containing protein n=1 Tax=Adineta ricciae TaxID=249248 RepID=A0A816EZE4_ADIRI|nr:unnamed protein product [Adineta ricciae]CAF1652338.1 unnamed protein product [Adineta ricciae]
MGICLFIAGLIGGPLVIIVFLSLRTFRQSSCAFYLTIMSVVNCSQLFTGLFSYIMLYGFSIDWSNLSLSYCKCRLFFVQSNSLISFTCLCLATIDQFLATCSHPRWHQYNNITFARYMVVGTVIFWISHGIPFILYYNHTLSSVTNTPICMITNAIFHQYFYSFYLPVLTSILPITIMIIFGVLSYRNIQRIAHRAIPLVRRELDKQLTVMVLVQVFCTVLALTPQLIYSYYSLITGTSTDQFTLVLIQSIRNIITMFYYTYFMSSLYIYTSVSKRFRQQLIYVLFTLHFNRWARLTKRNNHVEPQA